MLPQRAKHDGKHISQGRMILQNHDIQTNRSKILVFSAAILIILDVVQYIIDPEEQDDQLAIDPHRQRPEHHVHQTKNERHKIPMEHNSKTENNTHRDADPKYDLNDERRYHFAE
jgi:hypothetical protein